MPTAAPRLVFLPFIPYGLCLVAATRHALGFMFARTPRDALRCVIMIDLIRRDFGIGFGWVLIHLAKTR
jgi:hypothetical protein